LPAGAKTAWTHILITKSTNYQTIGTCVCIGENLAVTLPVTVDTVQIPCLSTKEMILHVGDGADWDQRRAFEWGLLCGVAERRSAPRGHLLVMDRANQDASGLALVQSIHKLKS